MRRRALIVTAVSLCGWLTWNQLRTFDHPWGDLSGGSFTDHFSHMNAARAFPRVGLDLWRKPAQELARAPTAAEHAAFPADVLRGGSFTGGIYMLEGWPVDKPWVTSWSNKPRLYPPGDLLLVAPVSLAYHYTELSLAEANRWLFALFLLYAHVSLFFVIEPALHEKRLAKPLLDLATLGVGVNIFVWTLQGFYDAAALAPLLLCARYLHERRGLAAAVAYSVAAVIHFRAFFLAPWALYAVWLFVRDRQWRGLRARDGVALAAGLLCAGAALCAFALIAPTLAAQAIHNEVSLGAASLDWLALLAFATVVLVAGGMLVFQRAWLDLAVLAWLTLTILFVKEAYPWHLVIPLAWLVAPVTIARPRGDETVRGARLLMLGYLGVVVFGQG